MMIALHKQARTTPAVRAEIAASLEPVSVLARRHNITEATVRKWRARSEFQDRPHTAHRLQTQLTQARRSSPSTCARACCCPWTTCWW